MPTEDRKSSPIQIDADDARQVVFVSMDEDRFVLTCSEAVRAAQHGVGLQTIQHELRSLLNDVRDWVFLHREMISVCYAAPRGGEIVVFVAPVGTEYDFTLAERLNDLDIRLAQQYRLWPSCVVQVPNSPADLPNFVPIDSAYCLHEREENSQGTAPSKVTS